MEFVSVAPGIPVGLKSLSVMVDRVVYLLAAALVAVVRRLPLSVCFALGEAVGALMWVILPGYRRLARENLATAFAGEMSEREIRQLTFRHFKTLGANALSAFKMPAVPVADIPNHATIENLDLLRRLLDAGRPVVIAINHIGNWELYAQLVDAMPGVKFGTVYQALRNPLVDELVNRDRRLRGVATFDRKKGFIAALALLRTPGILGVLVDQHAGDSGMWTPFFRRLASTSTLAATLAMRADAAVVPIAIHTVGRARWRVMISPEIPWTHEEPEKLTYDINVALERQIRESPADWFWVHNRWKTPLPYFLCGSAKRGIWLPPGNGPLPKFRIVVRSPNWLGDAVMSVDAARAYKRGRPDAHLAVLTPEKLAGFWQRVPEVDEAISIAKGESVFSVAARLRGRFEVAVLFPNSLRSALEVWLAGIRRRVGYRGHFRGKLLNQIVPPPKKKPRQPLHHADRYWRLAERCGADPIESTPAQWKRPEGRPLIALCPGAEYGAAKRWPVPRFREVIEQVNARLACDWVIVGTAADDWLAEEIRGGFDNVTSLTGKTTLDELMQKLCNVHALVTNDTGTMHLADFLGVPLVAVFGSTEPALTGPRGARSRVIRQQVECSPCFLRECPIDFRCMREVPTEAAVGTLMRLIE